MLLSTTICKSVITTAPIHVSISACSTFNRAGPRSSSSLICRNSGYALAKVVISPINVFSMLCWITTIDWIRLISKRWNSRRNGLWIGQHMTSAISSLIWWPMEVHLPCSIKQRGLANARRNSTESFTRASSRYPWTTRKRCEDVNDHGFSSFLQ